MPKPRDSELNIDTDPIFRSCVNQGTISCMPATKLFLLIVDASEYSVPRMDEADRMRDLSYW